jgi:hypothetical protein
MLRVGIIGTGLIATLKHLPAWKRTKELASMSAICDLDPARTREVAAKFGIPATYTSTAEMYAKEGLDLVDVRRQRRTRRWRLKHLKTVLMCYSKNLWQRALSSAIKLLLQPKRRIASCRLRFVHEGTTDGRFGGHRDVSWFEDSSCRLRSIT